MTAGITLSVVVARAQPHPAHPESTLMTKLRSCTFVVVGITPSIVVARAQPDAANHAAAAAAGGVGASEDVAQMCSQLRQCVGQCDLQASSSGREELYASSPESVGDRDRDRDSTDQGEATCGLQVSHVMHQRT